MHRARACAPLPQVDALTEVEQPWLQQASEYMAATILNTRWPHTFSTSAIGFVGDTALLRDAVRCSCPHDCNAASDADQLCERPSSFPPSQLKAMLQKEPRGSDDALLDYKSCLWDGATAVDRSGCRYNEVVLLTAMWRRHLPRAITAVFFPIHGRVVRETFPYMSNEHTARYAHQLLLRAYGLTAHQLPLLALDLRLASEGAEAFKSGRSEGPFVPVDPGPEPPSPFPPLPPPRPSPPPPLRSPPPSPPPRPPPPPVGCVSGFPLDSRFEECLWWCPNNPQANCPRCKCKACPACQPRALQTSPPPPSPRPTPPPAPSPLLPDLSIATAEVAGEMYGARLVILQTRGRLGAAQLAEVSFNGGGTRVDSVANPHGQSDGGHGAEALSDGDLATKWSDARFGETGRSTLDWSFVAPARLTKLDLFTADDAPQRDPVGWLLYGRRRDGALVLLSAVGAAELPQTHTRTPCAPAALNAFGRCVPPAMCR